MSDIFVPHVGAVFSADIAVPEHEREVGFYSRVLSTGGDPLWREADLMNNLGQPIIGLGARGPDYASLPLQWMPHMQVANVATSVERATSLGGRLLMHGTDETGAAQWAVLLDPSGAAFGLIPVVDAVAPDGNGTALATNAPPRVGRIAWLDLTVPDAADLRDFYGEVVSWTVEDVEMRDGDVHYADFNMIGGAGPPDAGICHARGVNAGLPPVWLIYLPVGDLAESLRRVEHEGGTLVRVVGTGDGAPVQAVIRDPVGAYLAIVQA